MTAEEFEIDVAYPASSVQEGMLFHYLLSGDAGVYVEQVSLVVNGRLDTPTFERAWALTLDHHPVLRSCFVWERVPRPLQLVLSHVALPVQRHDWRAVTPSQQQVKFAAYLEADRRRGFEPSTAPLMRLAVFALGERQHRVVWTHHQSIVDGWSVARVLDEVFGRYECLVSGTAPHVPSAPPFQEYVRWLARQDMSGQERFWRGRLTGVTGPTPLPMPRTPQTGGVAGEAGEYEEAERVLPEDLARAVTRFSRCHRLSVSTLLFGAWALVLARGSGEGDVVFGVTMASRPVDLPHAEDIVGPLTNTLPLRLMVDAGLTVRDWLGHVQAHTADLLERHAVPLVAVQQWSEIPPGGTLFESIVVVETYPDAMDGVSTRGVLDIAGVEWNERTHYPLVLSAVPGAHFQLRLTVARDSFEGGFAEALLGRFVAVLSALVADPGRLVGELDGLAEGERDRLLGQWNDTAVPVPPVTAAQLVARQVAQCPDAVAVVDDGSRLTYRELDAAAERVAVALRGLGVGPEQVVAVCLPRSCALLAAWLGVWKAGGAWLPLDPEHPDARLAYLLGDAGVRAVVTDRVGAGRIAAAGPALPVVLVDDPHAGMATGSVARAPLDAAPGNLAYLMYTSGSTGNPKGVEITHHNLTNLLSDLTARLAMGRTDTFLSTTTVSFDISVLELFGPLTVGARVVIAAPSVVVDGAMLAAALRKWRPDLVQGTPATWRLLLDAGWAGDPLLTVLCGGEEMPRSLAVRMTHRVGALWNMYGPTETTIWSTCQRLDDAGAVGVREAGRVPIGRPIANTRMYVLDQRRRLAPAGVAGELYIAGAGVARGYRGRPDLTAQRFLPDPFVPDGRMYRTGDRARWRPDGTLEYLGRLDSQVKIHGVRVEPGEIESVLAGHPAVGEAAVTAVHTPDGRTTLVAYVVPAAGTPLPEPQLRGWLSDRLPTPLVPARYVSVPALPRTSNNKLDRRALPPPPPLPTPPARDHQQPATATEAKLAAIWAEVLGVAHVDPDDNFFDLGGHSLLATKVAARVRSAMGVAPTLRAFFQHVSLRALAEHIDTLAWAAAASGPADWAGGHVVRGEL